MHIFEELQSAIIQVGQQIGYNESDLKLANLELPKDPAHGDLATNIAMIIAAKTTSKPRDIAVVFQEKLSQLEMIDKVEIAGPGFINLTLTPQTWQSCVLSIIKGERDYLSSDIGRGRKVNVEYVSANPTGPMHIGHARGAIYGDVLANLLQMTGHDVTKEYYVNDAGSQIDDLTESAFFRYKEAVSGSRIEIPAGLYPGEYLIKVGQDLKQQFGSTLLDMPQDEAKQSVRKVTINAMLDLIKLDLKDLGIEHEVFFSEESLHSNGVIAKVMQKLEDMGVVYKGHVPPPKGQVDEEWIDKEQLLFRSTEYGDDQDRPVQKANGQWSYLAADIAYAQDKIDRGFNSLVYVLGADHGGYVKRIEAIVKILSGNKVDPQVKLCQLVNFVANGVPVKMSKRQGTFTTVRDVIDEVGKDIIRFIMLTRKNDAPLDFDLEKVKEQSRDNPVFYVEYAHVRTVSILSGAETRCPEAYAKMIRCEVDLSLIASEVELDLIKQLALWVKTLQSAARSYEPHRIAFYLMSVAAKFHSLWNLGKENNDYRFVIEDNVELTAARLALTKAIQEILRCGFAVIGIEALQKM